ncbi:MAG: ATP-dependent DNA helicase RecG [Bacteroidales bacterium]|nr:ATP-dependent DNA helicase RecG [Bacteroidales bacterium]MCF8386303.1 ATP-dependent DNA helicase RecG [Bacteroidales bacterium]MCF8398180.1 ATP-dependent DNA helicase RecG [Bacteroidales bacterium]
MSLSLFENSIEYLKGVGPKRGEILRKELNICNFGDLLMYFPFRYIDKSRFFKISDIINDTAYVQLKGKITNIQFVGQKRGRRMTAWLSDDSGSIELVWFKGFKWLKDRFDPNTEYLVFGKPSIFKNSFNIAHPEIEEMAEYEESLGESLQAVYPSTEKLKSVGLGSKGILKIMRNLAKQCQGIIIENLPADTLKKYRLINRETALINIHFPKDQHLLKKAQARLKFEELFLIQIRLLNQKTYRQQKIPGHVFSSVGKYFHEFFHKFLPFDLTDAQKKVTKEIRADLGSGKQMNRLLQGDVGSGKTLVAILSMLIALDNNFQASFMAPTEILAQQHFETFRKFLGEMNISFALLTGSTPKAERKILYEELKEGKLQILIGTHALIEESVQFKNLGLVVIDEQHRFGVAQRAKLWKKNQTPPHVLVMTATPIPRTLAMTVYGDLDVSKIDELPPGRKSIKTYHYYDSARLKLFGFLKKEIKAGRQVYIVYPLIQESKKLELKDLMDGYESIVREFPAPEYAVSIVHGQMKAADKDFEMQRFLNKETQIMVATTVIEVGVDVPNASVMVIENAERFGLSQLHQLRGRVGRGADQSYCILMTGHKLSNEARIRLETMVRTTDGFEIAEVDLKLRGPGEIEGTRQSGILNLRIADLIKDENILRQARKHALEKIQDDPGLNKTINHALSIHLKQINKNKTNWGLIS